MSARNKIVKAAGKPVKDIEMSVAQALFDLENNNNELRADLRALQITAAIEAEVGKGRKAIVVFVPFPQLKQFHKIQTRLVRELEKKFSDRHVVIIAQRRVLAKPGRRTRAKQMRPRSRTLTAVHEAILDDLVFPTEIVGKRTKIRVDGARSTKIFLDRKDATSLEYKLDTFASVYKKLTGKDVNFEFPPHVEV
ncbi:ribosomal protein S7A [Sorochytrium milnesiophthora]